MSAASAGNADGVKWLLQSGADAAAADSRGRTALDYVSSPAAKVQSTFVPRFTLLFIHLQVKLAEMLPLLGAPSPLSPNRSMEEL
mgnify:CR=1 FL=1|jgi:hypothetical protein